MPPVEPLTADEIKEGIVTKIAEAVWESLNKTCNLYQIAYPKFSATFAIALTIDNFGTHITDNVTGTIPFTPPNVFRRDTGQPIPIVVTKDDGTTEHKAVFYRRDTRDSAGNEE